MQAYAAGLAEGVATAPLIHLHWMNTVKGYCDGIESFCIRLMSFLQKNLNWMKNQIEEKPTDPYWHQVKLMLYQLAGISDGYYGDSQRRFKFSPRMEIHVSGFM